MGARKVDEMASVPSPPVAESPAVVVVSLGKKTAKKVKQLEKGRGKLLDRVVSSLNEMKTQGAISQNAQPIFVIVKEPRRSFLG